MGHQAGGGVVRRGALRSLSHWKDRGIFRKEDHRVIHQACPTAARQGEGPARGSHTHQGPHSATPMWLCSRPLLSGWAWDTSSKTMKTRMGSIEDSLPHLTSVAAVRLPSPLSSGETESQTVAQSSVSKFPKGRHLPLHTLHLVSSEAPSLLLLAGLGGRVDI